MLKFDNLAVLEEYKWKWVWKILQEEIESWAKNESISDLELNVWDFNRSAIGFYEKNWLKQCLIEWEKL